MTKSIYPEDYLKRFRESIGDSIKGARERKGFSQEQLAEIMGIQRSTISKIETGRFAISVDYLIKFAWHLDFEVLISQKN